MAGTEKEKEKENEIKNQHQVFETKNAAAVLKETT